ncbi:MAG: NUDIX domain-containing protein [Chloroflexia bacterium]|nr:NUDIX domain-containing protein [Chloroflexia bacterium]
MTTELIFGARIGSTAPIRLTVTCALPDADGRFLLVRRADNDHWVLPGGGVEPGERVVEAVVREMEEETGIHVKPVNLIGIYSNPDVIISYDRGTRRYQVVSIMFLCEPMHGTLRRTAETTDFGYFAPQALPEPLAQTHLERIQDAAAFAGAVFVR